MKNLSTLRKSYPSCKIHIELSSTEPIVAQCLITDMEGNFLGSDVGGGSTVKQARDEALANCLDAILEKS